MVTNGPKSLAVLTGDYINEGFFQENAWLFCRASKKSGCNNEVTVLPRWRKEGFHCITKTSTNNIVYYLCP